jgi:class 3 adenylate cyclase
VASAGIAVLAGIASGDSIADSRAGAVWMGEHSQAAAYLEKAAGAEGTAAGRQLRRLMPLKNRTEYDPTHLTESESSGALEAARRITAVADKVVAGQQPS